MATNVLSDTIYMNGLFNGREDYSSRARIPSTVSVDAGSSGTKRYTLDMYEGMDFSFADFDISSPFKNFHLSNERAGSYVCVMYVPP